MPRGRRVSLICDALKFASESCHETERRLYKDLIEVRAQAENLLAQIQGEGSVQASLSDLWKHELEP
jgi:hypothetical protein